MLRLLFSLNYDVTNVDLNQQSGQTLLITSSVSKVLLYVYRLVDTRFNRFVTPYEGGCGRTLRVCHRLPVVHANLRAIFKRHDQRR